MIHKKSEKGQAIILIVFAIIGLIGITGLTVDGGMAYADRRQAQNAADSAALAGAHEMARGGNDAAITTAALNMIIANGYPSGSVFVSVNSPPLNFIDSNNDGDNECNGVGDDDGYDGGDDQHIGGGDDDDDNDGVNNSEDDDDDNDGIDDQHDNDDDNDGIDDQHDDHDNDNDNDGIENDDDDDDDNDGIDDQHDNDGIDDEDNDHDNDGIDDQHDNDDDNDGIDDDEDDDDDGDGNSEPTEEDCTSDYGADPSYIQVIITSYVDTYFAPVVGINNTINTVQAISRVIPPTPQTMYGGNAVVGLAPSGCDAVYITGNSQIETWGGGLFSNSTEDCGMHFQGSSQTQTHEGSSGINMVGGAYQVTGNPSIQTYDEGVHGNLPQYPYPPTNLPNPVCYGNATVNGSTMTPGNYNGDFPPIGVITLQSGVYCIDGDFSMNGNDNLTGIEVVLVMETGGITWNGNSEVVLTAPQSGPFEGLLLFAPLSNNNTAIFNGTADVSFTGTVLIPGADIRINGNNFQENSSQFIGYHVEISGSSDVQDEIVTNNLFTPATSPIVELVQ